MKKTLLCCSLCTAKIIKDCLLNFNLILSSTKGGDKYQSGLRYEQMLANFKALITASISITLLSCPLIKYQSFGVE